MFILRRILPDGVEINTCLGTDYVFVSRQKNIDEFNRTVELWSKDDTKEVYGVITYDDGKTIMPLYERSNYYIMTSDGKTFDNVTNKI
jgi:hypothetical protein